MMKVLVAHRAHKIRDWLVTTVGNEAYKMIEVTDGNAALNASLEEFPNIILLDVELPGMDGFEVLRRLKQSSTTEATPVILTTGSPTAQGESIALRLGAIHYIPVPCPPDTMRSAIRLALGHDRIRNDDGIIPLHSDVEKAPGFIMTGNKLLDQELDGGIPLQSLSMIEGTSFVDKSNFCQYLACASLLNGIGVTYFTSGYSVKGLIGQMESHTPDVMDYVRTEKLSIYPIEKPVSVSPERCENPERLLVLLGVHLDMVSGQSKVTIVDSIHALARQSRETIISKFFTSCWRLCDNKMVTCPR